MDFDLVLFDWIYYEIAHLITTIFLMFIIKPLFTLAMGRHVLIIVFSKVILKSNKNLFFTGNFITD